MSFREALSDNIALPVRSPCSDDPMALISRAIDWCRNGHDVALVTLVEIRGGAARALGAQMIVRGSVANFCGSRRHAYRWSQLCCECSELLKGGLACG